MKTLEELLKTGKIEKLEYDIYLAFGLTDFSRRLVDSFLMSACIDMPPEFSPTGMAWKEGRISAFRGIKICIEQVDTLMQEVDKQGGSTNDGEPKPITTRPTDFSESIPGITR